MSGLLLLFVIPGADSDQMDRLKVTEEPGTYTGPMAFTFLTASSLVISERTALSTYDLDTHVKTRLVGSETKGGYVDGPVMDARFSLINDVAAQGKYSLPSLS